MAAVSLVTTSDMARSKEVSDMARGTEEQQEQEPDCTITDRVYLEITKCSSTVTGNLSVVAADQEVPSSSPSSSSSPLSFPSSSSSPSPSPSSSAFCDNGEILGRIVIGLYGNQVVGTSKLHHLCESHGPKLVFFESQHLLDRRAIAMSQFVRTCCEMRCLISRRSAAIDQVSIAQIGRAHV